MKRQPRNLPIIFYPAPILRKKCLPITAIDLAIQHIIDDLIFTMESNPAQGLAAPQVGHLLRIFVVRFYHQNPETEEWVLAEQPTVFINPKITNPSKEHEDLLEGCLSLPGVEAVVSRPKAIEINALDRNGAPFHLVLNQPLQARVCMHENDHLNGVLHIDRADKMDRHSFERPLAHLKQQYKKS